jgi:peptide/nickel transport system permease protein
LERKKDSQTTVSSATPKLQKNRAMWDVIFDNKAAFIGLIIVIFLVLIAIFGKFFITDPTIGHGHESPPSPEHWFGTDNLGRDIFSRVIAGTGISITVGIVGASVSLILGTILGAIAGYVGGKIDTIIMRIMDMILAIPSILLAISLIAALGKVYDKTVLAVIAIIVVAIPEFARIVRGCVLSEKENDYVQAAKVIGNKDFSIIFKHVMPNVASSLIVRGTLEVSTAILNAAALGFLGLGVQPPHPEWGTMLSDAHKANAIFSAPYMMIFPGLAITITVLAFNMLGDGLRDILDPKSGR